jgi:hypothetical protein
VIFCDDNSAGGGSGGGRERSGINGLDRVTIDNAGTDTFLEKDVGGLKAGVQGHSRADERYVVLVGKVEYFRAADWEGLLIRVKDRVGATGGA